MAELTCVVKSCGDARSRPLGAKVGHTAVSLHGKRVVEMRIQVSHDDRGLLQVSRTWLEADLLATGDARGPVAELAHHVVGEVTATPGHQRWAPGQLHSALC